MTGKEIVGYYQDSHATIHKKISETEINWHKIRAFEQLSTWDSVKLL
jgi:hypothetical protein